MTILNPALVKAKESLKEELKKILGEHRASIGIAGDDILAVRLSYKEDLNKMPKEWHGFNIDIIVARVCTFCNYK